MTTTRNAARSFFALMVRAVQSAVRRLKNYLWVRLNRCRLDVAKVRYGAASLDNCHYIIAAFNKCRVCGTAFCVNAVKYPQHVGARRYSEIKAWARGRA